MSDIYDFPGIDQRNHKKFAKWLRIIADLIETDELAHPPVAVAMVITSRDTHEIHHIGHREPDNLIIVGDVVKKHAIGKHGKIVERSSSERLRDHVMTPDEWRELGL